MTIYLAIRSDSMHSLSISLGQLVERLSPWPELRRAEAELFEVIRAGTPRACLNAFACSSEGNYAVFSNDSPPMQVNLIELRYPYEECEHGAWYDALAIRVAHSLGWEAWGIDEDGNDLQLWPSREIGLGG
jgi:hypothetical protein